MTHDITIDPPALDAIDLRLLALLDNNPRSHIDAAFDIAEHPLVSDVHVDDVQHALRRLERHGLVTETDDGFRTTDDGRTCERQDRRWRLENAATRCASKRTAVEHVQHRLENAESAHQSAPLPDDPSLDDAVGGDSDDD